MVGHHGCRETATSHRRRSYVGEIGGMDGSGGREGLGFYEEKEGVRKCIDAEVEGNLLAKGNVGIWRPKDGLMVDGKLQTIGPAHSSRASPCHVLLLFVFLVHPLGAGDFLANFVRTGVVSFAQNKDSPSIAKTAVGSCNGLFKSCVVR